MPDPLRPDSTVSPATGKGASAVTVGDGVLADAASRGEGEGEAEGGGARSVPPALLGADLPTCLSPVHPLTCMRR